LIDFLNDNAQGACAVNDNGTLADFIREATVFGELAG
jgi:hypothetical protein